MCSVVRNCRGPDVHPDGCRRQRSCSKVVWRAGRDRYLVLVEDEGGAENDGPSVGHRSHREAVAGQALRRPQHWLHLARCRERQRLDHARVLPTVQGACPCLLYLVQN